MKKSFTGQVNTQGVSFGPILKHYFDACGICEIIDNSVPTDKRRKVLSHGQASNAMITGILFQVLQLYKVCKFANETTILDIILPGIKPEEYFDDRLADTLDALYKYGLGDLELQITKKIISEFDIKSDICHNDTTSASVYGNCSNNKTPDSIRIDFGYSKKKRKDLKQLVWSMSVSSDSAFPLFQQAYSGNTSDVETYVEQWHNLIDLLGEKKFLYVGDSKLVTKDNITHIHDNDGYFIAPVPMYASYKKVFHEAILSHTHEQLIPYKDKINRGFEIPVEVEHRDKLYTFRMIVLYDHGLFARKSSTLNNRVEKTRNAFQGLNTKLNKYNLKTYEAIKNKCASILKKNKTEDFFEFTIENNPQTFYKNKKRGKPAKNKPIEKTAVETDHFSVTFTFCEKQFDKALHLCGYYPLITNKPEQALSIENAMLAHKNQYKSEHTNRRVKSCYNLEPIYLHTPERIESLLFLFKIALQVVVLIERTARKNIENRDKGLDVFMPNRKDVRNPKAEYLLAEFQYIVSGEMKLPDGNTYGFVSELNELQKDILSILEVPQNCFGYEYIFGNS